MSIFGQVERLLERAARDKSHSGRKYIDHGRGVAELLREIGAPRYVVIAGFCHSVYSTDAFEGCFDITRDRAKLQSVIGSRAEALVFAFCLIGNEGIRGGFRAGPNVVFPTRISGELVATPRMASNLALLYLVNIVEQLPHLDDANRARGFSLLNSSETSVVPLLLGKYQAWFWRVRSDLLSR